VRDESPAYVARASGLSRSSSFLSSLRPSANIFQVDARIGLVEQHEVGVLRRSCTTPVPFTSPPRTRVESRVRKSGGYEWSGDFFGVKGAITVLRGNLGQSFSFTHGWPAGEDESRFEACPPR